ncbi:Uncharacterised protein [Nocardia otitidiscaviarum]|uniref:Uncharacterized protein n=1 Tax=Nocardia otitidiscaviarum TaxID=1823 RepID=A0A378YAH5_9NOCA|nr:hypothetical protein [Nocardia otitidiscaviarum]SUA73377.1 Uncharacterised protein [Nocardia otitidiscaviarum]
MAVDVIAESIGPDLLRFRDEPSGCMFYIGTPQAHPRLWRRNIDGALGVYRHYGVDVALDYDNVIDGHSTALFMTAIDAEGQVVAGLRAQRPYRHVDEAAALLEWSGHPGEAQFRRMIAERIPAGVVELKAAWVARDTEHRVELGAAIPRGAVHLTRLLGARYGLGTAASHAADRYRTAGGVIAWWVPAVPYPDERYRTVPMWWDLQNLRSVAEPSQMVLIDSETDQLSGCLVHGYAHTACRGGSA